MSVCASCVIAPRPSASALKTPISLTMISMQPFRAFAPDGVTIFLRHPSTPLPGLGIDFRHRVRSKGPIIDRESAPGPGGRPCGR